MSEFKKNLFNLWKYLKQQKKHIILSVICDIFRIFLSVVVPILSARVIVYLTNNEFEQLIMISIVILILELLRNIQSYLIRYNYQIIYRETLTSIQRDLARTILKIENQCIDKTSSGLFIQRLTEDTSSISDIFTVISRNLSTIIADIGIFLAIFLINKIVFLYLVIMIIVYYIIERKRINVKNENDKVIRKHKEITSGFIGELVRGVRDLKMLNAEKSFMKELDSEVVLLNDSKYKLGTDDRNYCLVRDFTLDFFDTGIIFLLVYLFMNNKMEVASALVIYNYMRGITSIVGAFSNLYEKVKEFNLSSSRVFSIMDDSEFKKEKFGSQKIEKVNGDFEFKDVSFSYDEDKKVLDNLSFKIDCNTTTSFVGKSGAGKTTIFSLLCKMYDDYTGLITIDGVDIKKLDKDSIRGNITIISQNPYIFNMSIRRNLSLVKEDMTDEEMREACRMACLDDFIDKLPDSYDTVVGEGGISLSGGQRQRLALARAFLQKTEIILFDEATSALDNETQKHIQMAISNMKREYTILIIAHRLSTIVDSDKIFFLNEGKIEDVGTHKELLKKNKNYKKLYEAEVID